MKKYSSFEVLMKFFDFVDGVKEDQYLKVFFSFVIDFLKDGSDYVLMHIGFASHDFVIVFDSLEGDFLSKLFLNHFIDVEFDDILNM